MPKSITAILLGLMPLLIGAGNDLPLFGSVVGVAEDDVLNVRSRPDYRTPKVGEIAPHGTVGIKRCRRIGTSRWCRIFGLAQNGYDGGSGWVNARFLRFFDRGYVLIDARANCDYALSCDRGMCDVVTGYETDKSMHVTRLHHRTIPRSRLRASSRFGAMDDSKQASGYCTSDHRIEEYLKAQSHKNPSTPQALIRQTVRWIHTGDIAALARHIHPRHGVRLSWQTDFRRPRNHTFGPDPLRAAYRSHKKLDWGTDTAKGDPIRMDLKSFFRSLTRNPAKIASLQTCDCHGFTVRRSQPTACYEARWITPRSKTGDYNWLGLVVVLEQDGGAWHIVGLLHNRWEI